MNTKKSRAQKKMDDKLATLSVPHLLGAYAGLYVTETVESMVVRTNVFQELIRRFGAVRADEMTDEIVAGL